MLSWLQDQPSPAPTPSSSPPKPAFTEKDVPDLTGKVYLITGANSGIGKELARVLYSKNAKVYVAARSEEKAKNAIRDIRHGGSPAKSSGGELVFLPLDLSDLNKVKEAARAFLAREGRLDVLFNNAGVLPGPAEPPAKTAQGYELSLGVNCVGHFLLTKLLTPLLVATAKSQQARPPADGSVRVVWLSSFGLELSGAEDVGVDLGNLDYRVPKPATERYGVSKAGAWALGVEFARRHRADGVVSVPVNPGNLKTELARDQTWAIKLTAVLLCYPTPLGVCTVLFFSPDVTLDQSGSWGEFPVLQKPRAPETSTANHFIGSSCAVWSILPTTKRLGEGNQAGGGGWYWRRVQVLGVE
jgi:retinol dehydrogenase-12